MNSYTYNPFGQDISTADCNEGIYNPFKFTGQWYDLEISQYYLRARMYDPALMRFTARDPVRGKFAEPLTLHKYLYCNNDTINKSDPSGRYAWQVTSSIRTGAALYSHGIDLATHAVATENMKFWNLADWTFKFMPVGMTIAQFDPMAFLPGTAVWVGQEFLEQGFPITGMGSLEGFAMDPAAYMAYRGLMLAVEVYYEVTPEDMQDFVDWKERW